MPSALLAGATGLVGGHLLRLLAADPAYERVVAVGRRPLPEPPDSDKLEQFVFPLEAMGEHRDRLVADHVFCALGTTRRAAGSKDRFREVDLEYPRRIARIARQNGARHFSLVSSMGADPSSRFFYTRVKGEAEAAVREAPYYSGAIFRPSFLGGEREGRPLERLAQALARWLPGRWRRVEAEDVARAMVAVAKAEVAGWRVIESAEIPRLAR